MSRSSFYAPSACRPSVIVNAPPLNRPESLVIRFSRSSDLGMVEDLFNGSRKQQIDPDGYIRPRAHDELRTPVETGSAALAFDEKGEIRACALASYYDDIRPGYPGVTEIGALASDVGGIGLSKTVTAMLSLKQTFDPRANERVYSKVAPDNAASNKIFSQCLGWKRVTDPEEINALFDAAYHDRPGYRERLWYQFSKQALLKSRDILKSVIEKGALVGRAGHVAVDVERSSLWSTLNYHEMLARPKTLA